MPRGTGSTVYSNDALQAAPVLVFTGKGSLRAWHIFNTTAAELYVQFYDKATAAEANVGNTTHMFVLGIPAETASGLGSGTALALPHPVEFTNGCVAASTTAVNGASNAIAAVTLFIGD